LSALLRKLKVGHYLHLLPGVRRDPLNENFLIITTHIARILPLQVFHLLGFRRLRWTDKYLVVSRRAFDLEADEVRFLSNDKRSRTSRLFNVQGVSLVGDQLR